MDASQGLSLVFYVIVAFFVVGTLLSGFFQVRTAEAVVIQRMGKFLRVANAGMNFKLPWLDQIAGRIDLRVQQLALDVETKTKDNVFVKIPVSVQYHVIPEKVYEAFYKLANPKQQISSCVFNVILGHVPKMNLDDAFLQQSDLAGTGSRQRAGRSRENPQGKSNTIFVSHSPSAVGDLFRQMQDAVMIGRTGANALK